MFRSFSRTGYIFLAIALVFLLVAGVFFVNSSDTQAAPENVAWKTRCVDLPPVEGQEKSAGKYCEMFSALSVQETGQVFMDVAIGYPNGQDMARGVVKLPLGILLTDGIAMQVDDGEVNKFYVRTCVDKGCFAYISVNDALLGEMKRGNQAVFAFKNAEGRPISVPFPLSGFTKALKDIQK